MRGVLLGQDIGIDRWGNKLRDASQGVAGVDELITTHTTAAPISTPDHKLGDGHWAWRTVESWVQGSVHPGKREWITTVEFDG